MNHRKLVKAAAAAGITSDRVAVRAWLADLPAADLLNYATEWLLEKLRLTERESVRVVEQDQEAAAPPAAPLIDIAELESAQVARNARLKRLRGQVTDVIARHQLALGAEWTPILRQQPIRLPDGTRTTWGAATAEQHEMGAINRDRCVAGRVKAGAA